MMNPHIDYVLHRIAEGRLGAYIASHPGDGHTEPYCTEGVCHALGHDHWSWEGIVTYAPHGYVHLRGDLVVLSSDGETLDSYEYSRTYRPRRGY
jgi:hypothetical protein